MTEPQITANEQAILAAVSGGDGAARKRISRFASADDAPSYPAISFAPTDVERSKRRRQAIARTIFMIMSFSLVIPVIAILIYLVDKAWPVLSWSFLIENPRDRMTAGGIWAPLVGTFCLVLMSLLIAAPIGVLAGVYLNEYTGDTWLRRVISLAVVNLAGVPSIVHGLFGV